jgi:hypothetical protein
MKARKILIAVILVLVTVTTFAQAEKGLYAMVKYSQEMNRLETWVADIHERINHEDLNESYLPVISTTYYIDYADISYENEYSLEPWMTVPFEDVLFEDAIFEENLNNEPWMNKPFETEELQEELRLEDWMATSFWL